MSESSTRRQFIRNTALAGAGIALAGTDSRAATKAKPSLVTIKGPGVPKDLAAALRKLLAPLGGMGAFVKKGQRVLIKPNLGFPHPPGVRSTTSPELVAAVVREVLAAGAGRVRVMDSPAMSASGSMADTGLPKALAGLDTKLVLLDEAHFFTPKVVPRGRDLKKVELAREALAAHVHIALPVAKSHGGATFTGVLKGMMGLIRDRLVFHTSHDLHQAICDLNTVVRPSLSIMDGLSVMTSGGLRGPGPLQETNALIAGTDPVAVDAAGVQLAPLFGRKLKPAQVTHLRLAAEAGLGKLALPDEQVVELGA